MRGRVIVSAEGTVTFSLSPSYHFKIPQLLVRCGRSILCDILPTLLFAVLVGSLTLMVCGQLDRFRHSASAVRGIDSAETSRTLLLTSQGVLAKGHDL